MNRMKRLTAFLLCVMLILPQVSFAETRSEELLATVNLTYRLPMWHYSGGYWKMGSGTDVQKIADKTVDCSGGLQQFLTEQYTKIPFCAVLPRAVRQALQNGSAIKVRLGDRGNASLEELFLENSCAVTKGLTPDATEYCFTLCPQFHVDAGYTFDDFVDGLHGSIPLVHYRFGNNIYSVFSAGKYNAVQADGFFDEGAPTTVKAPYLHPTMIRDKSGALKDGGVVSINGKTVAANGLSIGDNTFAGHGATGIMWVWSLTVSFYQCTESPENPVTPDDPEDPAGPGTVQPPDGPEKRGDGEAEEGNPAGQEDTDSEEQDDGEDRTEGTADAWSVRAALKLPALCYEGQWITAEDCSDISRNGELQNLQETYATGLAAHSFHAPGAEKGMRTTLSQELRYTEAGIYTVGLDVESSAGDEDSDAKAVRVVACPSVSAVIGGCQKENRRQTITVEVHQSPGYPINDLSIWLEEPASGQRVTISRNDTAADAAPENTEQIKCRPLKDLDGTEDTLFLQMEFLTKFHEDSQMRYHVTAVDTRGCTATAEGSFLVKKDVPPQVSIGLADCFYREKNSNTAVITASDKSTAAGRCERTWKYAEGKDGVFTDIKEQPAFTDNSMGTGKEISFCKEGVGEFRLQLTVKDLWTEETLEEYVTDSDHLQATAEACSRVDNLAPAVSLETRKAQKATILLLADSRDGSTELKKQTKQLQSLLAAGGTDAEINVDFLRSEAGQPGGEVTFGGQIHSPCNTALVQGASLAPQYGEKFWNNGHYTADDDAVYVMDSACFEVAGKKSNTWKRTGPFYVTALDGDTHSELWRLILPEGLFRQDTEFLKAEFGHDVQNQYLYLTAGEETLLMDKSTGAMAGMTGIACGRLSYAAGEWIYTFRADGIYRISMTDGFAGCIRRASICADPQAMACIGNTMRFCEKDETGLWLCTFRPDTEGVTRVLLSREEEATCKGIDSRGYVFILESPLLLRAFDRDGSLLSSVTLPEKTEASVLSRDAGGQINFILASYRKKTGSAKRNNVRKYNYVTIKGIFNGYEAESYFRSERGGTYRSGTDVEMAIELADGVVAAIEPCVVAPGVGIAYSYCQYNFDTINDSSDHRILCQTGVPATKICAAASSTNLLQVYNTSSVNIGLHLRLSENREDERARLMTKWLGQEIAGTGEAGGGTDSSGTTICLDGLNGCLTADQLAEMILAKLKKTPQPPVMRYRAGEVIDYSVFYSDYEGDPSKASFWCYVHEPDTDGLWKSSGKVLTAPVRSFSQNGRYILTHWQTDDAGRGVTDAYDKDSRPVSAVIYIESTPLLPVETPEETPATEEQSITGTVEHTAQWEANRQTFNRKYHGQEGLNTYSVFAYYRKEASPRLRGVNVFWPGESLQLKASLKGDVRSVSAEAVGTGYRTVLLCSRKGPDGSRFTGALYDSSMTETLCQNNPKQVTIRFTAVYTDGSTKTCDVPVIFDQDIGYWMLHRTY